MPFGIKERRYGHCCSCFCKTLMPAESHTRTTTSFGGVWPGWIALVMAVPSGAVNPLKSKILACVGAISARVTLPPISPWALM